MFSSEIRDLTSPEGRLVSVLSCPEDAIYGIDNIQIVLESYC